eukprot:m51a1_g14843 Adaptor protein complex 5 (AP-5), beta subunit (418) ;mRNA; f:493486-494993
MAGPPDWSRLAADLRSLPQPQQQRPSFSTLDALLSRVAAERSDDAALRSSLLSLLQENALAFIDEPDRANKALAALTALIAAPADMSSPASALVKAQAMEACTSIVVEMDAVRTQTHTFETFVAMLLDAAADSAGVASRASPLSDRVIRSAACQCLRELEDIYPGLLCEELPRIYGWVCSERTQVAQECGALLLTALRHSAAQAIETGRVPVVEGVVRSSRAFCVPPAMSYGPSQCMDLGAEATQLFARTPVFDQAAGEVLKAVGKLLTGLEDCSELGVASTVALLEPFARAGMLPPSALQPHLEGFVHCGSPLLLSVVSHLSMNFQDIWAQDIEELLSRLCSEASDFQMQPHWRALSISWMSALAEKNVRLRPREPLLQGRHAAVAPSAFDPLELKEARLRCLTHCFDDDKYQPPE